MAWDRDSRADVDRATNLEWQEQRDLRYHRRGLDEAAAESTRTKLSSYLPPVVWLCIGLGITPFTKVGLDAKWVNLNGGMSPAWLFTFGGVMVAIFSIVGLFAARDARRSAPFQLSYAKRKVQDAEAALEQASGNVALAIAEANAKEAHTRRVAGMQEKLVAIAEYIGTVNVPTTGKKKVDNLAWAAIAGERGWSAELAGLVRAAQEMDKAAKTSSAAF